MALLDPLTTLSCCALAAVHAGPPTASPPAPAERVPAARRDFGPPLEEAAGLVQKGEYAQARVLAEKVIAEAARAGDLRAEATARLRLGDVHYYQGRTKDYRLESERALAGFERAGDDRGAALALYQLAYVYERTEPAEMLPVLERARARAEKAGDLTTLMKVHNAFGTAAWGLGRYALALDRYGEAAKLARRLGRENNLGVALANMGMVEQQRANPERALVHLVEALPLLEKSGNRLVAANVLGSMAATRHSLGDLERATALHEKALGVYRQLGTPRGQATQLAELASISRALGDRLRAESQLRQALKLAFELGDARQAVYLLKDLGSLLIDGGNADRAEAPLREAVSRAARHGDPLLEAEAILALADLYAAPEVNSVAAMKRGAPAPRAPGPETQRLRKQRMEPARGKTEAALALADQALALAERHHEPYTQGLAQARRGELLETARRWPEAAHAYRKALALHEARRIVRHLHGWYGRLARLAARAGDDQAAAAAFEESLRRTESLDRLVALDRFRLSLFREVADVYRGYAGWLAGRGEVERAWEVLERGRARDLRLKIAQAGATEMSPGEQDALVRLSALHKELAQVSARAERERLDRNLLEAEADYDRARREALPRTPVSPPLTRVVTSAAPGDLVVEYAVDGDRLLVFSRRQGRLVFRTLDGAPALLERARRFREAVSNAAVPFTAESEARSLFDVLLGPDVESVAGGRLTIVPDADLVLLPFAALRTPDGRWLGERFLLSYAPSLAILEDLRTQPLLARQARVLAIASTRFDQAAAAGRRERLPAAATEARAVARRGAGGRALVDPTEREVKALSFPDFDVVHFASHLVVDELRPERSAILLAPDAADDGLLQAREIYRLRLPARLVVVSSCRSGAGAVMEGEGVVGLSHALYAAGARALLTTLWDVTDRGSAAFMSAFYQALETRSVAEAVMEAQARLRGSGEWSHPAQWAGYQVSGDTGQARLVSAPPWPRWLLAAGMAGGAILLAVTYRRLRGRRTRS